MIKKIKIILVEPEQDLNVGSICRIMKNFGFRDLVIVNPKCPLELDAIKFSKHALNILEKAKIVSSFEEGIYGTDLVIGTSAIENRYKDTIRGIVPLSLFSKNLFAKIKNKKLAIVFGRESTGLKSNEISLCDLLIKIEASAVYPTMNVSSAAAVILYTLATHNSPKTKKLQIAIMDQKHKSAMLNYVDKISKKIQIRNPNLLHLSFKRMLIRSLTTEKEAEMLLAFLRLLDERI